MSYESYPFRAPPSALLRKSRHWKVVQLRRLEARESFCRTLSTLVQNVDWNCFGPDSDFLGQLLFFFNAKRGEDVDMLCKICDILLLYVRSDGDLVSLFAGVDSSRVKSVVVYRLRKLAFICLHALHEKRFDWASSEIKPIPFHQLLEFAVCLMNPNFQWSCEIVEYLQMKKVNCFFRGVIAALLQSERHTKYLDCSSALSKILTLVASHVGNYSCHCSSVDPRWSFSSQILSIPSLWHSLPDFKKAFCSNGFISNYILEIASCADVLPTDILANHPGQACLLANVLETATWILSEPDFAPESRAEIIGLCTSLLDGFPKITSPILTVSHLHVKQNNIPSLCIVVSYICSICVPFLWRSS
nr:E3 ubiquitin-protein ligase UPL6-like [Lolium perenne]